MYDEKRPKKKHDFTHIWNLKQKKVQKKKQNKRDNHTYRK